MDSTTYKDHPYRHNNNNNNIDNVNNVENIMEHLPNNKNKKKFIDDDSKHLSSKFMVPKNSHHQESTSPPHTS